MTIDVLASNYAKALTAIWDEFVSAKTKFPSTFNTAHEGFAVIYEELDELWDEVKSNGTPERLRREALQVAAVALQFAAEFGPNEQQS